MSAAVRVSCLLAFLGVALPLPLPADDWPLWLGPAGDGVSAEKGWRKDWPEGGPPRLFEKAVGEGYSAVAVARGRLVLFHRRGNELRVEALDPLTGKEGWRFAYPTDFSDRYGYNGGPRCAPIIGPVGPAGPAGPAAGQDLVFTLGPTGVLHALALGTGELVWKRDLPGEHGLAENFFGVGAAPLLDRGTIYVHLGGTDPGTGQAFALEAATGKTLWKSPTDGGSYAAARLAAIDGARHLFVFHRGGLSDLDPANGRERWKFPWYSRIYESVNAATPLVIGDVLFFTATYGTGGVALHVRQDGHEVIWQDDLRGREKKLDCHWSTPIHRDGHVYGFAGRHEQGSDLRCVELLTGKVLWTWEGYLGRGSMTFADGHFITLGERGDLALLRLSPKGHEEVRRVAGVLRYPAWTPPVLANGILYLRDESRLIAMDLRPAKETP